MVWKIAYMQGAFIKNLWKRSLEKRVSNGALPWMTFLLLPAYLILGDSAVRAHIIFGFDTPHPIRVVMLCATIMRWTLDFTIAVWVFCLIMYFRRNGGRQPIYCWLPLLAFGLHMAAMVVIYEYL